jgi:diguanylate cyclase (GGDEF)-like protein
MGPAGEDGGQLGPAPFTPGTGLATALPETSGDGTIAPTKPDFEPDSAPNPTTRPAATAPLNSDLRRAPAPAPVSEDLDPTIAAGSVRASPWVVMLHTIQLAALIVAALAVLPLELAEPRLVFSYCAPIVLICTALLFAAATRRDRDQSDLHSAWALFAVATTGIALIVVLRSIVGGGQSSQSTAAGLTACSLVELTAVWLLLRGRSPRWAPSTGWDGSVVALGATAIGIGLVELSRTFNQTGTGATATDLARMLAEIAPFIAVLTALAITAPPPRPQLLRLAGGLTAVTLADVLALTLNGTPALLTPVIEDETRNLLARGLGLLALTGYAALGLGATDLTSGRRADRRRRPGARSGSLAGGVVVACTVIVAAAVLDSRAPRVAAGLALACLGIALARTRRALREVQQAGRLDPRPRTDDLTGLANRRALSEALAGDRHPGGPDIGWAGWAGWADEIALLLVDLDRFKDVNDGLGHEAGDRLLTEVGARLRTALRPTQLLARLGGDEFAIVLPAAGAEQARRVAEGLLGSLLEPFEIDGSRLHVQASIGMATCHPSRGEPKDLLRQADVAMYQAKSSGTGIELYDPERDEGGPERLRRTDELRQALQRGDIEVHIQPQVDLRTGVITGAEALARWRHPEDGVLLPDSFLPLAEHTGLMRPVAAVVLDRALEACATWWLAGHHVPVSVNLGADDLRDPKLPGRVTDVLKRCCLPADALRVEITEQALLTDPAAAAVILARWRADGIAVAIDDFGTGYSSLSYLRELPIDEVKLDRAFIADIRRPTTSTIVRHTVAMAHGLWARVVAEGIEDEATARILTDLGCDVGQGLYFGPAMTTSEFIARLQAEPR